MTDTPAMMERVARALCFAAGDDPDQQTYTWDKNCSGRDRDPRYRWEYWVPFARAAIEAMREPDIAMLEAAIDESGWRVTAYTAPRESGVAVDGDISPEDAEHINQTGRAAMASTYAAMISAALGEV